MNYVSWSLLLSLLPGGSMASYARPPRPRLVLTRQDAARPVVVKRHTLLAIQLEAHFGRGYSWVKTDSCSQLAVGQGHQAVSAGPRPPAQPAPPSSDSQTFLVLTKRRGTCYLKFAYRQPFDTHTSAQDSLTFTLRIQ